MFFQATGTAFVAVDTVFKHPYNDCSVSRMPSDVGSESLRTSQHQAHIHTNLFLSLWHRSIRILTHDGHETTPFAGYGLENLRQ